MRARMTPMMAAFREGVYKAVVEKIEPNVGTFGEYLKWSFMVVSPKGEAATVTGLTSCIFSKKSKFYDWASTIVGKHFEVNEELDTDTLHGKTCRLWLTIKELDGGSINAIKEVLPPEEDVTDDDENPFT
jgi:hypothetical protein